MSDGGCESAGLRASQARHRIPGFAWKKRLFDPETRAATDEEVGLGFTDYQVRIEVLRCESKDPKSIDGWRLPSEM
jgi:hypothetical protein